MFAYGQSSRYGKNLHNFERRKFHFGAHLGGNYSTFRYELKTEFNEADSLKHIDIKGGPGMSIQLPLVSWNPIYNLNFRFLPSLSFHETVFTYSYMKKGELKTRSHRSNPTNLSCPLQVKLNSKRMNNFGAYAMGGFAYTYNLTSEHDVEQLLSDPIIKMKPHDFAYQVGGGFDFFLPYFKFGIEIKMVSGIKNILIQDDTFFAAPLESLKTYGWWFSLTFEG